MEGDEIEATDEETKLVVKVRPPPSCYGVIAIYYGLLVIYDRLIVISVSSRNTIHVLTDVYLRTKARP